MSETNNSNEVVVSIKNLQKALDDLYQKKPFEKKIKKFIKN